MRILWLGLGLAGLALGALGVVLPLLPTTPFVLLAAYCFARSSPALHDWLLRNPIFGALIRDWQANRAISRGAKTASVLVMVLSLLLSVALGMGLAIVGVQALFLACAAAFVLTRNTAA